MVRRTQHAPLWEACCVRLQIYEGIGQAEEPTIFARDLAGQLTLWVEVGLPDAERMHRAAKAAPRTALYTHRDAPIIWRNFESATIHRAEEVPLYVVDVRFLRRLGEKIERRTSFDLSITERQVFLGLGGETFETSIPALPLQRQSAS